jgi:hypothetical protein
VPAASAQADAHRKRFRRSPAVAAQLALAGSAGGTPSEEQARGAGIMSIPRHQHRDLDAVSRPEAGDEAAHRVRRQPVDSTTCATVAPSDRRGSASAAACWVPSRGLQTVSAARGARAGKDGTQGGQRGIEQLGGFPGFDQVSGGGAPCGQAIRRLSRRRGRLWARRRAVVGQARRVLIESRCRRRACPLYANDKEPAVSDPERYAGAPVPSPAAPRAARRK